MRFWIDRSQLKGDEFLIKGSLYHHICRVAQIKRGEIFELFCEGSQKYKVQLSSVSSVKAIASILEIKPVPPLKKPFLHLALSVSRLSKMDSLIEKAVELGVKDFHPFISTLSFLKKPHQLSQRQNRWKKIVEQSLALSGRTENMRIHNCCFLQEIDIPKEDKVFFAYEGQEQKSPALFTKTEKSSKANAVWLFIGSEGGFTQEEVKEFSSKRNVFIFSMGEQILRVETACLFGLSVLKYHYHL